MPNRRELLKKILPGVALATSGGLLWAYLVKQNARATPFVLRPPGARAEADFNALCIKCGRCVAACPYDTLKLAALGDTQPVGTPYFLPRRVPCYLCEDIPCKAACPSGALDPGLQDVMNSRMGLAFMDIENCLSWQGLRCEICYRVCPLREQAISIEARPRQLSRHAMLLPIVHSEACTGCGICEQACPTEQAAIKVMPADLIQGQIGEHYRLGGRRRGAVSPKSESDQAPAESSFGQEKQVPGLDYLNQEAF